MTTPDIQEIEHTMQDEPGSTHPNYPAKRKLEEASSQGSSHTNSQTNSHADADESSPAVGHNKRSVIQIVMDGKEYRDPAFYFHTKDALLLKNLLDSWRKPSVMKNVQVKLFYPEDNFGQETTGHAGQETSGQVKAEEGMGDTTAHGVASSTRPVIMRWISMDANQIQIINGSVFSQIWTQTYLRADHESEELTFIVDTKELFDKSALADISDSKQELHWLMTADGEHVLFVPKFDAERPSHSSVHRFSEDLHELIGKAGSNGQANQGKAGQTSQVSQAKQSNEDFADAIVDLQALLPRLRVPRYSHKMRAKTLLECIKSLKKCRTDENLLTIVLLEDRLQLVCNKKIQTLMKSHAQEWIFGVASGKDEGQEEGSESHAEGKTEGQEKSFKMHFNILFLEECTKILECSPNAQIKLSFMEMQVGDHVLMIEQVIENQHLGLKREGQDDDTPLAANLVVLSTKHTDEVAA